MSDVDRIKQGLVRVVRNALLPRVDYFGLYPAKVNAQNSDLTLELTPDDTRFHGMSRVPIRLGIPGATVKIAIGARVLLGFEAGDPSKPVATLWDTSSCTELALNGSTVIKLNGGSTPVAKEGSQTVPHTHTGTAGPYPVTLVTAAPAIAVGQGSSTVKVP